MDNFVAVYFLVFICSILQVHSFAGPFSDLWTVSKTFSNGGFEGDVKLPVLQRVASGWEMTIRFDKPVKGFQMWRGKIDDVGPDYTYYVITNQDWNAYLQRGSTFEFNILGYSQGGLPSMEITFQNEVFGRNSATTSKPKPETDENFSADYDQVIRLSLLFLEAKRSGKMPDDNRIEWKGDSGLYDGGAEGYDLTGGYYIGGDYVKFGFPMAFALTQLSWGALEFPRGYIKAGDMINLLKAVKWGTDYFIKAHVEENVFFGMVGDPAIEHGEWEGGFNMNWRRPAFKLTATDPGSDVVGETAAALASAAFLFIDINAEYSSELIRHATQLYEFADTNRVRYDAFSIPNAKEFYPSTDYGDELVWAALWLYKATGDNKYLDDAVAKYDEFRLASQRTDKGMSYDNKILAVQLLLSELTAQRNKYIAPVMEFCDKWSASNASTTPDGLLSMPKVKAPMGFVANTAFLCALAADQVLDAAKATQYKEMAKNQIEEVLGKNGGVSYMVGYGDDFPTSLHDRESSCPSPPRTCGWDFFNSPHYPNANQLRGAVVGGPDSSGNLEDTRKNFVGNQPHILHNSAFQSAVAAISHYSLRDAGTSVAELNPRAAKLGVFPKNVTSQFDACMSNPCDKNGVCTSIEGFNYLCQCPDNVFGRNCENRMAPVMLWINTWNIGAEINFKLPNIRPIKPWQLKVTFPNDCPLEQIDVWNACLNVLDSSRENGEIFLQQIDWQRDVETIGMRFQFTDPRFVRNCFREESFQFLVVEEGAQSLIYRSADNCPRFLPHAFEGSGSGYFDELLDISSSTTTGQTTTTTTTTTTILNETPKLVNDTLPLVPPPPIQSSATPTNPPVPATPATLIVTSSTEAEVETPKVVPTFIATPAPPPTRRTVAATTEFKPTAPVKLLWQSTWVTGGQGEIHIEDSRPNDSGEWILRMQFPAFCPLQGAQFWGACAIEALNKPEQGLFVFEQISWQIYQNFFGFTVYFDTTNIYSSQECFLQSKYTFTYEVSKNAHNFDVNICPNEFKDIQAKSSPKARSESASSLPVNPKDDKSIVIVQATSIPADIAAPETTQPPMPIVSQLNANVKSDSQIQLSWSEPTSGNIEITYRPSPLDEVQSSLTAESPLKKSASQTHEFTKAVEQRLQIPQSSSSILVDELTPGMRYQFTGRLVQDNNKGPPTSVFMTTTPKDVLNIHAVSLNDTSIQLSWSHASGIHGSYRVTYFPEGDSGEPKSPFYVTGEVTSVIITGLTTGTDFIASMTTKSGNAMSEGVYAYTKTVVDQCSTTQCSANEVCENDETGPVCVCMRGFNGKPCVDNDECFTGEHTCHPNAGCQNIIGSYSCSCKIGYTGNGIACFDIDECADTSSPCDGPCTNTIGSYTCACPHGYIGDVGACVDIDECAAGTANCPDGSTCINTQGSYTCSCGRGVNLVETECIDIDECSAGKDTCGPFSMCSNTFGSYACVCVKGFVKVADGVCEDIDECNTGSNTCHPQAKCQNVLDGYRCNCNPGYEGNGRICKPAVPDTDECATGAHSCSPNALCENTDGSYTCTCSSGYTGDGKTCLSFVFEPIVDADECTLGSHLCDVHAACTDTPESYDCTCITGYHGNGTHCEDIDECSFSQSHLLCPLRNTKCVNMEGSYGCECVPGWSVDEGVCVDVDECALNTHDCNVNANCLNQPGSFACDCTAGYEGDGRTCTALVVQPADVVTDECTLGTHLCDVHATCTDTPESYDCTCMNGYHGNGTHCEDTDECSFSQSHLLCPLPNTRCVNMEGSYGCECVPGWSVDEGVCVDVDECALNTHDCNVNANCLNQPGSFNCACNSGYEGDGRVCTASVLVNVVDLDECTLGSHLCDVHAACTNTPESYDCTCMNGYHGNGTHCEDIDECSFFQSHALCPLPNTRCVNREGSYGCECVPGWSVKDGVCVDIDECALNTHDCSVNANCANHPGSFVCSCVPGYEGDGRSCTSLVFDVANDADECTLGSHLCDVHATCTNTPESYDCTCMNGYHGNGTHCEDIDECSFSQSHLLCPLPNTRCVNMDGAYGCECAFGFSVNGGACVDVDECALNTHDCNVNANCLNEPGSYKCSCKLGFVGDGKFICQ